MTEARLVDASSAGTVLFEMDVENKYSNIRGWPLVISSALQPVQSHLASEFPLS